MFNWLKFFIFFICSVTTLQSTYARVYCPYAVDGMGLKHQRVPILIYHHIGILPCHASAAMRRWTITPQEFKTQMDWVYNHGFHTVSMEALAGFLKHGRPLPVKPMGLTFDDGLKEHYQLVYPILKKYHFVGTFFIITESLGHSAFMKWHEIKQMSQDGMDIEAHTMTHPNLSMISHEEAVPEIVESKKILEKFLNKKITVLAYPYGSYNDDVIQITKKAGYEMAVKVSGINNGYIERADDSYSFERYAIEDKESLDWLAHRKFFDRD